MFKNRKIKKLIKKLTTGADMTKEDLQLYANNSKEVEARLRKIYNAGR